MRRPRAAPGRDNGAMKSIRLHAGKEKSLLRKHPWVFDGAIARGGADSGETVRIESHEGRFLAWAAFSPRSRIRARVWSFDEAQRIDAAFVAGLIDRAVSARDLFDIQSDGVRLVHGESDGLPGLVVDRYGDVLVAQFTSCGSERWKSVIASALLERTGLQHLYERSDASVRQLEGLEETCGWLAGEGSTQRVIREHGWRLGLDIARGHKTGFYLDQRDSRQRFFQWTRQRGFASVLNCFCYTGGFSLAARHGGAAQVVSIDSSADALAMAASHEPLNGFEQPSTWMQANVFDALKAFQAEGRQFDLIVLDPPKFAPSVQHLDRASRAYKDINMRALRLLAPEGLLFTFSCSGAVSVDLFQKIVAGAVFDAGVDAQLLHRLSAGTDHPMAMTHPEGEYLKGLLLRRM